MRFFYENLPDSCQGGFGEKVEDIQPLVEQKLQPGDIVLVKGSKYTRVITIVDRLLKQLKPAEKVL